MDVVIRGAEDAFAGEDVGGGGEGQGGVDVDVEADVELERRVGVVASMVRHPSDQVELGFLCGDLVTVACSGGIREVAERGERRCGEAARWVEGDCGCCSARDVCVVWYPGYPFVVDVGRWSSAVDAQPTC